MADNPFLGVRLPPVIHQALLDRAAATGQNRSEIAIAALAAYLDLPADNNNLTSIKQQLSEIKQRLSAVEQALSNVKQNRAIAPPQPTQSARSIPAATGSYTDFEDEPDEVLTEFLEPEPTGFTPPQKTTKRAIAPSADEAAADGWLNQQEVAKAIGVHKSTLASKRQQVSEAEFLAYIDSKSPHRWEFDRSLGKAGMYRAIAPADGG